MNKHKCFKIKKSDKTINNEKEEIIKYGLQIIIGEIPKIFIILLFAWLLDVLFLTIFAILIILPYRTFSGGLHLRTHFQCIVGTSLFYSGTVLFSKLIVLNNMVFKFILIFIIFLFSIAMICRHAPADTYEVPILNKKDRLLKKKLSYIAMSINLIIALIINNNILSNIIIFITLFQSLILSNFMYKITNCKYGYENYYKIKLKGGKYLC